jgi:MYXO-CTERM domain-containing protein
MNRFGLTSLCLLGAFLLPRVANATKSAELYTSTAYPYGRFEARMRFAGGDGIVSAFFLWKDKSEQAGMFWNELDYEKIGASCELQTNALFGNPSAGHTQKPAVSADLCGSFHVYAYEWTADHIAWSLDGAEIRRETGDIAAAYAQNASAGMQIHFNLWPGDATFGGNFDPGILPVYQYVDWVQFSSYADGAFTLAWREDFGAATAPTGWLAGNWTSSKNLSTHDPLNVNFVNGCAVLSMTADTATGAAGAMTDGCTSGAAGASGNGGTAGMPGGSAGSAASGAPGTGGTGTSAGSGGTSPAGGTSASGAAGGSGGTSGMTSATAGMAASPAMTAGTGGTGAAGTGNSGGTTGGSANGAGGSAPSSGGAGPAGGDPSSGGAGMRAGAPAGHDSRASDTNGCGCRLASSTGSSRSEGAVGAALMLGLAGAFRRRRAARGGRSWF